MTTNIHLLVLIHGMWGNPTHLAEMHRIFTEKHVEVEREGNHKMEILLAQTNKEKSTYDGIDWGGERIADEVYEKIEEVERGGSNKVAHFSIIGYSLGGLLARYVVGVLQSKKFFDTVKPVNFATVATPHIGLLTEGSFRMKLFASLGPYLLARTGEHFYGVDKWAGTNKPLLEIMSEKDSIFYQGLGRFKQINIYANAVNDRTVPFVTAAIEPTDPFMNHEINGLELTFDEQYDPLVKSYQLPAAPPPVKEKSYISFSWFKKPFLPPPLQFRFPFNYMIGLFIPVLLPLFIGLVIFRLGIDARASRARIRLLENDEARTDRLISAIRNFEKQVDDAVADMLEDPGTTSSDLAGSDHLHHSPAPRLHYQPVLRPSQKKMISSLNGLPQMKKHFAFIHPVVNSHATIISRDVKRFAFHKRGEGVLRHMADHFEME